MKLYEMILVEAKDEYVVKAFGPKILNQWYLDTGKKKPAKITPEKESELALKFVRDNLVPLDPTPNQKFLVWIAKLYSDGNLKQEDFYKVPEELTLFQKVQSKLVKKDIMQYKSLPDLVDATEPFANSDEPVSNKAKSKAEREQQLEGADLVHKSTSLRIYHAKTEPAACELGKGTKWCTAATKGNNYFGSYNRRGPLYVLLLTPPTKDSPYQLHVATGSDEVDDDEDYLAAEDLTEKEFVEGYPVRTPASVSGGNSLEIANKSDRHIDIDDLKKVLNSGDLAALMTVIRDTLSKKKNPSLQDLILIHGESKIRSLPMPQRGPLLMSLLIEIHTSAEMSWRKDDFKRATADFASLGGMSDLSKFAKTPEGMAYVRGAIRRLTSYGQRYPKFVSAMKKMIGEKQYEHAAAASVSFEEALASDKYNREDNVVIRLAPELMNLHDLSEEQYLMRVIKTTAAGNSDEEILIPQLTKIAESPRVVSGALAGRFHKLMNNDPSVRAQFVNLITAPAALSLSNWRFDKQKMMPDFLESFLSEEEKAPVRDRIKDLYLTRKDKNKFSRLGSSEQRVIPVIGDLKVLYKKLGGKKPIEKSFFGGETHAEVAKNQLRFFGDRIESIPGWYEVTLAAYADFQNIFGVAGFSRQKDVTRVANSTFIMVAEDKYILYAFDTRARNDWLMLIPFDTSGPPKLKISIDERGIRLFKISEVTIKNAKLQKDIEALREFVTNDSQADYLDFDPENVVESKKWTR